MAVSEIHAARITVNRMIAYIMKDKDDPGLGRSPGEGHDNPLQYSCLENPMDRGAWRAKGLPKVRHD